MRTLTIALLLLGASTFTSCKKGDTSDPTIPVTPVVDKSINATQLLGKWEMVSFYQLLTVDSSGALYNAGGYSQTYHENGIRWDPKYASSITFNADKTFDHANKDNTGDSPLLGFLLKQHGRYEIKNTDTALSLMTILSDTTTVMEDYKVVTFKSDYFELLLETHYIAGHTNRFYLGFKR